MQNVATWFSNGMPRLCLCVRAHFSPLCCWPWWSSQFPVTCSPSFFTIWSPHWPHTLTRMQSSQGCQIFSLINWLYFILFNAATSFSGIPWVSIASHAPCGVWALRTPFPRLTFKLWPLTIWWIAARLRQGVRHSRIRYKLSLLQGIASHLGSCHLFATPFPLSIFPLFFSPVFRSFLFRTKKKYRFFLKHVALILFLKKKVKIVSKISRWQHWGISPPPFLRMLTDVSLSPSCHPTLELSVESKFGQCYCVFALFLSLGWWF